jgi:hypothetical protein
MPIVHEGCAVAEEDFIQGKGGLGGKTGLVTLRSIWDLAVLHTLDISTHGVITYLWFTEGNHFHN